MKKWISRDGGYIILTTLSHPETTRLDLQAVKHLIYTSLDDDKAEDIVTIDLKGKSSFADTMVIASGRSARHVASIATHVSPKLKDAGHPPLSVEGLEVCDWVLVDFGDVIVHIFRPETRHYYSLEKMWSVSVPQSAAG